MSKGKINFDFSWVNVDNDEDKYTEIAWVQDWHSAEICTDFSDVIKSPMFNKIINKSSWEVSTNLNNPFNKLVSGERRLDGKILLFKDELNEIKNMLNDRVRNESLKTAVELMLSKKHVNISTNTSSDIENRFKELFYTDLGNVDLFKLENYINDQLKLVYEIDYPNWEDICVIDENEKMFKLTSTDSDNKTNDEIYQIDDKWEMIEYDRPKSEGWNEYSINGKIHVVPINSEEEGDPNHILNMKHSDWTIDTKKYNDYQLVDKDLWLFVLSKNLSTKKGWTRRRREIYITNENWELELLYSWEDSGILENVRFYKKDGDDITFNLGRRFNCKLVKDDQNKWKIETSTE